MIGTRDGREGAGMSVWRKRILRFFRDPAQGEALTEVLSARACREGWLQGQLFRWMRRAHPRSGFEVNKRRANVLFDISADDAPMVGELKVLGSGYQTKVVGGALRDLASRLDRPVTANDAAATYRWGLLKDYSRLMQPGVQSDTDRILVLVVADPEDDTMLGRVLTGIRFQGVEQRVEGDRWLAKVWSLDPG